MHIRIAVNELSIEEARRRAHSRFEQADRQLARELSSADAALAWLALGALVMAGGLLGMSGVFALPPRIMPFMGAALALGGAFVGYALPVWIGALGRHRRGLREWHDALELVQLRERQAREEPGRSVEVLECLDGERTLPLAAWRTGMTAAAGRYVQ